MGIVVYFGRNGRIISFPPAARWMNVVFARRYKLEFDHLLDGILIKFLAFMNL